MNRGMRAALAAAVCGALVGIPALAGAQPQDTPAFTARDVGASGHWDANGDHSSSSLSIVTGGTVTFGYPSGTSHHNVVFTDAKPSSCTGLPGDDFSSWGPGWSGYCRFDRAGTYPFVCAVHPDMTGTVNVSDPAPSPTPSASPGPTATATPGPYATPTPAPTAVQTTLRGAVKLARHQKGTRVRGSVQVKAAGSRLEVALWVPRSRLSGGRGKKLVRVGRSVERPARAGRVAFSVRLVAKARAALRRRHRLAITVTVALTPPGSYRITRSLHITLRRN